MKWVINSYHGGTDWVKEYTSDVIFYDKKDKNVGSNIHDYMSFIVDNYENLPDVTLFGKSNMLERHITKEEFDRLVNNRTFTPLLTQHHKTYLPTCWYEDGMYCELNDFWYLNEYPLRDNSILKLLDIEKRLYNKFAPGACYIVPKENILQHPKEFYTKLRDAVDYSPNNGEAYLIERSLYHLWKL